MTASLLPAALVRVEIFEDLQCSDCAAFQRMLDDRLLPYFGGRVVFVHRDFPLARHSWAKKAAIAARYFSELNPKLGAAYRRYAMSGSAAPDFDAQFRGFAQSHSVDVEKAFAALDDARLRAIVERDIQEGIAMGVARTPTVFVNGKPFVETFSIEEISGAIGLALR